MLDSKLLSSIEEQAYLSTNLGNLRVSGCKNGISSIIFVETIQKKISKLGVLNDAIAQLKAYFIKDLIKFDLKLNLKGTDFQIKVWNELLKIPFGKTLSYKALAEKLGDVNKTRAVGLANAKNPIAIIVPCHRIIGHAGDLTGYAWGIEKKRKLLELEGAIKQLYLF